MGRKLKENPVTDEATRVYMREYYHQNKSKILEAMKARRLIEKKRMEKEQELTKQVHQKGNDELIDLIIVWNYQLKEKLEHTTEEWKRKAIIGQIKTNNEYKETRENKIKQGNAK